VEEFPKALELLEDENLVWSSDFELIRKNLASLMAKAWEFEYHSLEPELGDIALNLVRGTNARRPETATTN
jgi:hypothetical protein